MAFQCHVCGKEYNKKFNLNYHVAHHSDSRPFTCNFNGCSNSYKTQADLRQHKKSHEKAMGLNFFCTDCGANFDSSTKLNVHMRESHYSKGTTTWCELCQRHFAKFRTHYVVVHEKRRPFACDLDGKTFAKMHGLLRHVEAVHLKITPFPCTQCQKKFKEASALKKHLEHHSRVGLRFRKTREAKPVIKDWSEDEEIVKEKVRFNCGSCYKGFSSKNSLFKHELRFHLFAKFICDVCGKRFESKSNVTRHIVDKHSLNQPAEQIVATKLYKCGACKKIISSKSGLERHKRLVHLAILDFMCEQCSETFRDRCALNRHLEKYHQLDTIKNEIFHCFICSRQFLTSYSLEKHETFCRLKKQKLFNLRELDIEARLLTDPEIVDCQPKNTIELDEINIKPEPVEYIEQCLESPDVEEDSTVTDPFTDPPLNIEFESEEHLEDEVLDAKMVGEPQSVLNQIDNHAVKEEHLETASEVKNELAEPKPIVILKMVQCKSCPKLFSSKEKFLEHFKSSHDKKNDCQFSLPRTIATTVSLSVNGVRVKKFKCVICSQVLKTVEAVKKHHADRHEIKASQKEVVEFQCVHCPQLFNTSLQLEEHYTIDHRGKHQNRSSINKVKPPEEVSESEPENIDEENLVRMFDGKTFNDAVEVFECKICPQKFKRLQLLKLHCVLVHRIKNFKCNHCNHSLSSLSDYRTHWGRNHATTTYKESFHSRGLSITSNCLRLASLATCKLCLKTLSCEKSLRRHTELIHNDARPSLYCDQCADTFKDFRTLRNHVKKRHTELEVGQKKVIRRRKTTKAIECVECGEIVYGKIEMQTHRWEKHFSIKIVGNRRFHCLICRQVMNCRASAMRHHIQVHNRGKVKVRTCHECEMDFMLFEDFKRHVEVDHDGCFICLVCGVACASHIDFLQHKRIHLTVPEDEKKLACDVCGFKAQQKVTIEAHMVRDHGALKKKYFATCEYCGVTFNCYQSFNSHRKTHRQQFGAVKFKCNHCDRTYFNMRELRNHEGSHTNPEEKPYRCAFEGCNREYVSYSSFRWHFKYSHKENRNQCKACHEILTSREKLIEHCEEKHPELRRFVCNYCGKSFASQAASIRHMKHCEPTTVD